jgi:hypothetical protein
MIRARSASPSTGHGQWQSLVSGFVQSQNTTQSKGSNPNTRYSWTLEPRRGGLPPYVHRGILCKEEDCRYELNDTVSHIIRTKKADGPASGEDAYNCTEINVVVKAKRTMLVPLYKLVHKDTETGVVLD